MADAHDPFPACDVCGRTILKGEQIHEYLTDSRQRIRACSLCHYPNGKGRSENAPITGFPVSYFVQQMVDFKNGKRQSEDQYRAIDPSLLEPWDVARSEQGQRSNSAGG